MAPLYPQWSNAVYRAVLLALALALVAAIAAPMIYVRTAYSTGQHTPISQPVEFDHRHHVRDDGIDCLFCHQDAESAASAGIPATELCMGCHSQIWRDSPTLARVRQSAATGEPIAWVRVHDLPDFVYFHHGVHVSEGIACARCHGDVSNMAAVAQIAPLTMGWCLDCHARPSKLREPLAIDSSWEASLDMAAGLASHPLDLDHLTTCTACHR